MLLAIPTNKTQSELGTFENFPFDLLKMTGKESIDFLQRISTSDFSKLGAGDIKKTLLITEKGRVIDAVWVIHKTDYLLLLVSSGMAQEVSDWLNKYIIMEDIAIENVSAHYSIDVHFDNSSSEGECYKTEYFEFPITLSLKPKSAFTSASSAKSYERWRIENGIPLIKKELVQDYNPLELNLWDWISFTKGCYIGQEVIARLDAYNKIQRTLCKIHSEQSITEGDVCIDAEGNEIGRITSVIASAQGFDGLAVVRMKFAIEGAKFHTKNSNVEVVIKKVFQKQT